MTVHPRMCLRMLMERMGKDATLTEACHMRDLLCDAHEGRDTADIPSDQWTALLICAVADAEASS